MPEQKGNDNQIENEYENTIRVICVCPGEAHEFGNR